MQWTAATSSNRLRQTVQNFLLWCVGSDQQCATGFLIKNGAIPEHGVTTLVTHFSWTIKLHTAKKKKAKKFTIDVWRNFDVMLFVDVCAWIFQCEFSLSFSHNSDVLISLKMWTYDVNKNSMHFSVSMTCAQAPLLFKHDTFYYKKNLLFSSTLLLAFSLTLAYSLTKLKESQDSHAKWHEWEVARWGGIWRVWWNFLVIKRKVKNILNLVVNN